MARVNHKRVKQLLNEKRSRITDRQFFTSRILAGHFEDMAMAQTRRYKYNRRIHVAISWSPKSGEVACTNNLSVLINAGHRLVTQNRGRENRYEIVCGLFAHELGHCLYTDFLAGQTYNNYLSREKWYPEPPAYKLPKDTVNERALWEYVRLESRNNEMLRYVAHHISKLLDIHLSYPANTMTRICKKLSLPKKAALEAIGMFEMAYGGGTATAHDVFMAMQEIPYILKSDHAPESKMLVVEENMARALTLRWGDYDLAKAVSY